ncbi:MAG: hypothetical protein C4326_07705 [Ignavibacteria bacterium]
MHVAKRLGIPTHLSTRPLTDPLRNSKAVTLMKDLRPSLARQLRERELHAALISPLDYAKESSDYCLVPDVAVASGGNGSIVVRFREGLQHIKTLAVDPEFPAEILLTKIILAEEFDIEPTILPLQATVEAMLEKADAALLTGDAAFYQWGVSENVIDIVEEWNEMTSLPYVHALWCGWADQLSPKDIELLQTARKKGVEGLADIAKDYGKEQRRSVQEFLESFTYDLTPEVREALAEFLRYLYYHGVMPDIADLNFYTREQETGPLATDGSPP